MAEPWYLSTRREFTHGSFKRGGIWGGQLHLPTLFMPILLYALPILTGPRGIVVTASSCLMCVVWTPTGLTAAAHAMMFSYPEDFQNLPALFPQVASVGPRLAHSPPQHQLGVLGHILLHEVIQECFEDVSEVLQLPVQ